MRATIKDIARETGLSVSTVSLALSDKRSRVSPVTKQRVRAVAERMEYRPNQLASGLITRKTRLLGLVQPDLSNFFHAKMAKGAGYEADSQNYNLMLFDTDGDPDKDIQAINTLLEHRAEGILLIHSVVGDPSRLSACLKECRNASTPVVQVGRALDYNETNSVVADLELGGYMATKHLLDYGHQRIGCITGPMVTESTQKRLTGYRKALQDHGIPYDSSLIAEGDYMTECGFKLVAPLIESNVTAIFAFSDLMTFGAYQGLRQRKIDVPGRISLIGFDATYHVPLMDKTITTVLQPAFDIGRTSVSKLIKLINHEPVEKKTVFTPELFIGESTARLT